MSNLSSPSEGWILNGRRMFVIFACFFGVIAIVNSALLYLAIKTWSGAETGSAYRAGQMFQGEIAHAQAQDALGWTLKSGATRQRDGSVLLTVDARGADGAPVRSRMVLAELHRPTAQREDRAVALTEVASGRYEATLSDVASGQWDLMIDVADRGERQFRRKTRILLP